MADGDKTKIDLSITTPSTHGETLKKVSELDEPVQKTKNPPTIGRKPKTIGFAVGVVSAILILAIVAAVLLSGGMAAIPALSIAVAMGVGAFPVIGGTARGVAHAILKINKKSKIDTPVPVESEQFSSTQSPSQPKIDIPAPAESEQHLPLQPSQPKTNTSEVSEHPLQEKVSELDKPIKKTENPPTIGHKPKTIGLAAGVVSGLLIFAIAAAILLSGGMATIPALSVAVAIGSGAFTLVGPITRIVVHAILKINKQSKIDTPVLMESEQLSSTQSPSQPKIDMPAPAESERPSQSQAESKQNLPLQPSQPKTNAPEVSDQHSPSQKKVPESDKTKLDEMIKNPPTIGHKPKAIGLIVGVVSGIIIFAVVASILISGGMSAPALVIALSAALSMGAGAFPIIGEATRGVAYTVLKINKQSKIDTPAPAEGKQHLPQPSQPKANTPEGSDQHSPSQKKVPESDKTELDETVKNPPTIGRKPQKIGLVVGGVSGLLIFAIVAAVFLSGGMATIPALSMAAAIGSGAFPIVRQIARGTVHAILKLNKQPKIEISIPAESKQVSSTQSPSQPKIDIPASVESENLSSTQSPSQPKVDIPVSVESQQNSRSSRRSWSKSVHESAEGSKKPLSSSLQSRSRGR